MQILIVEDNLHIQTLLQAFLEICCAKQMTVETAVSADEAIEKLRSFEPDIVFLDHNLAPGTGETVAAAVLEAYPESKIVSIASELPAWKHDYHMGKPTGEKVVQQALAAIAV